jgi:hypothetical protein
MGRLFGCTKYVLLEIGIDLIFPLTTSRKAASLIGAIYLKPEKWKKTLRPFRVDIKITPGLASKIWVFQ